MNAQRLKQYIAARKHSVEEITIAIISAKAGRGMTVEIPREMGGDGDVVSTVFEANVKKPLEMTGRELDNQGVGA